MRGRAIHAVLCLSGVAFAVSPAFSQQSSAARSLAATCFTCHGTDGHSAGGVPPSLAGRPKNEMIEQMREFRSGARASTVMQQQAKGYTDQQLELIATYFASVPAAPAGR